MDSAVVWDSVADWRPSQKPIQEPRPHHRFETSWSVMDRIPVEARQCFGSLVERIEQRQHPHHDQEVVQPSFPRLPHTAAVGAGSTESAGR